VALAFHRARLKAVYQVLRGKDVETGQFSQQLREAQFDRLRTAQASALDLTHWHRFMACLVGAGFRSDEMISSQTALLYSYSLYLLGKLQCHVEDHVLQRAIARFFFFATLTGRYTSSPESIFEADLNRVKDLREPAQFVEALEKLMANALTSDFWTITLPAQLETSSARSPAVYAFYAVQNRLGAPVLFSDKRVGDLLDPALRAPRSALERHHLFQRAHLEKSGVKDLKVINQAANFALVEWPDNANISKSPPPKYVPELKPRFSDAAWERMHAFHALPLGWEQMPYLEFLQQRRVLMAALIRRGFDALGGPTDDADAMSHGTVDEKLVWSLVESTELALRALVTRKFDERFGARATDTIRKVLGEEAWTALERNREKHLKQYPLSPQAGATTVLDYTYLGQLTQLMMCGEAWEAFRGFFKDKRQLEDIVKGITAVRNDRAHFRAVPTRELERCKLACEDLLALVAKA